MNRAAFNASRPGSLAALVTLGFDRSYQRDDDPGRYKVRCSQCEALVIQGVPTHEGGCPNRTRECAECGEVIPRTQRLCDSCADPQFEDEPADTEADTDDERCHCSGSDDAEVA
jgi:hypothetical protein